MPGDSLSQLSQLRCTCMYICHVCSRRQQEGMLQWCAAGNRPRCRVSARARYSCHCLCTYQEGRRSQCIKLIDTARTHNSLLLDHSCTKKKIRQAFSAARLEAPLLVESELLAEDCLVGLRVVRLRDRARQQRLVHLCTEMPMSEFSLRGRDREFPGARNPGGGKAIIQRIS